MDQQPKNINNNNNNKNVEVENFIQTSSRHSAKAPPASTTSRNKSGNSKKKIKKQIRPVPGAAAAAASSSLAAAATRKKPIGSFKHKNFHHLEELLQDDDDRSASWKEVGVACCCRSLTDWFQLLLGWTLCLLFLYFFLFGYELVGSGAKVMGGCVAGELFGDDQNPVAAVMVGILSTVLIQSSSTTTSVVVSLVGSNSISVKTGIYIVFGANIGTTSTNTIVSFGHMGDPEALGRAFAGATLHDMFNYLTMMILFPLEVTTGFLSRLTAVLVRASDTQDGDNWEGPVKRFVKPLADTVIKNNKNILKAVASGGTCDDFYPLQCDTTTTTTKDYPTYETCSSVGLITCSKETGKCPAFFQPNATVHDDQFSGFVVFLVGLCVLFISLFVLVHIMHRMLLGTSTRIIYKATNFNGYVAILLGVGITLLDQSSSITTSIMTPLVGMGVLRLDQMYPITLGANLGTTIYALLGALTSDGNQALRVALAHLFFNITGIMIFFPIPFMRQIPIFISTQLGIMAQVWQGFPIVYILVTFFGFPLILLGLSTMLASNVLPLVVTGSVITAVLLLALIYFIYWWSWLGGRVAVFEFIDNRRQRQKAIRSLVTNISYINTIINGLASHTKLVFVQDKNNRMNNNNVEAGISMSLDTRGSQRQDWRYQKQSEEHSAALSTLANDMEQILDLLRILIDHTRFQIEDFQGDNEQQNNNYDQSGMNQTSKRETDSSESASSVQQQQQEDTLNNNSSTSFTTSVITPSAPTTADVWREIPILYRGTIIITLPLMVWFIVWLFLHHSTPFNALGYVFTIVAILFVMKFTYKWFYVKGRTERYNYWKSRNDTNQALMTLPHDMRSIKFKLDQLCDHIGIVNPLLDETSE